MTPASEALYRNLPYSAFPVGENLFMLCSWDGRRTLEVDGEARAFLDSCWVFLPLSQHLDRYARMQPRANVMALAQAAKRFAAAGFLVSPEQVTEACLANAKAQGSDPAPKPIGLITVPTCNRPDSLERCLRSYMENLKRFHRTAEFLVVDDSEENAVRQRNRSRLAALAGSFGMRASYCGPEERLAYSHSLAEEASVPKEVVLQTLTAADPRFRSAAASRNVMLLHAVGELFFSGDDDTVAELFVDDKAPDRTLGFTSAGIPPLLRLFPDEAIARRAVRKVDRDLLAAHEAFLGRSVAEALTRAAASGPVGWDLAGGLILTTVARGDAECAISWMGLFGDPGMTAPTPLLLDGTDGFEEFVASEGYYRQALLNRQVLEGTRVPMFSDGFFCQTTALAYDNRLSLPPFCPGPWGAEILIGLLLRATLPQGLITFLPEAISHRPQPPRTFAPDDVWKSARSVTFTSLLNVLLVQSSKITRCSNPKDNLRAIGMHFMDAARAYSDDFETILRTSQVAVLSELLRANEFNLAKRKGAPAYWAADVRRVQEEIRRGLDRRDFWIPEPVRAVEPDADKAVDLLRDLVFRIGQIFWHWPAMREAAERLKAKGIQPGCPA